MLTLSMSYGFFTKVVFKSYGSTIYNDDKYLTEVAKYGYLSAAISRFTWAALQEKFGFKKVYISMLFLQLFLTLSMTLISSNRTMYLIWIMLSWSCEGGHYSIFPPLAGEVYGPQ